jgi:hypothetical protein
MTKNTASGSAKEKFGGESGQRFMLHSGNNLKNYFKLAAH